MMKENQEPILNEATEEKQVLNLLEAAKFLGTSPKTLSLAVAKGEIPCKRLGKRRYFFLVDALRDWLWSGE